MIRKWNKLKNGGAMGVGERRPWLQRTFWSEAFPYSSGGRAFRPQYNTEASIELIKKFHVWEKIWKYCRWQHDTMHDYFRAKPLYHCPSLLFFFSPFSFFLVGKLLEPFKKWLFMVKTWKSNYACFSSSLPWPVLQSANQQHPLEKPLGKHLVILATHLEKPGFRFKLLWN